MGDKKIHWGYEALATAGDTNWKWDANEIMGNDYIPSITLNSVSGFLNVFPSTGNKLCYFMIAITDGAGSYPFDATTLDAVNTDLELIAFLSAHRDKIWMTLGGLVLANQQVRVLEFDASTKRVLNQGQNLVLIRGVRNPSGIDAGGTNISEDLIVFYS